MSEGENSTAEGGVGGGGGGGSLFLTACSLPENKQTTDYYINANLNVSQ